MKIPPFRAVEHVIKSRSRRFLGLVGRAAERFGHKDGLRMVHFNLPDKALPERRRHLVSRVAAKSFEPQPQQMFYHAAAIAKKPFRISRMPMIELRQVLPNYFLRVILAARVHDAALGIAREPLRVLARERR